jgi:hypothetical protein
MRSMIWKDCSERPTRTRADRRRCWPNSRPGSTFRSRRSAHHSHSPPFRLVRQETAVQVAHTIGTWCALPVATALALTQDPRALESGLDARSGRRSRTRSRQRCRPIRGWRHTEAGGEHLSEVASAGKAYPACDLVDRQAFPPLEKHCGPAQPDVAEERYRGAPERRAEAFGKHRSAHHRSIGERGDCVRRGKVLMNGVNCPRQVRFLQRGEPGKRAVSLGAEMTQ